MMKSLLEKIQRERKKAGLSSEELNKLLDIGPGWVEAFENGKLTPSADFLIAVISALSIDPGKLFLATDLKDAPRLLARNIEVEDAVISKTKGANVRFRYNSYDAVLFIESANSKSFNKATAKMREMLCVGKKKDAVVETFATLVKAWPAANPSDVWLFIMSRLYSDPYFHPATEAYRDFGQSWKRTAGWALEQVIVNHYREFLATKGIEIGIYALEEKNRLLSTLKLNYHVEANKADILINTLVKGKKICFGVAHVKASIAERRQNDQNFSLALLNKNFFSPFVTMDCKSTPSATPINKGEFGVVSDENLDKRRDKRKEFEEEGYYSGCYSFNENTMATPKGQQATSRISLVNFRTANDDFSRAVVKARDRLFGD